MGEAVLVEVWLEGSSVEAYKRGLSCRRVALIERPDGTFTLGVDTSYREMAAAGVTAATEGVGRDGEDEALADLGGAA